MIRKAPEPPLEDKRSHRELVCMVHKSTMFPILPNLCPRFIHSSLPTDRGSLRHRFSCPLRKAGRSASIPHRMCFLFKQHTLSKQTMSAHHPISRTAMGDGGSVSRQGAVRSQLSSLVMNSSPSGIPNLGAPESAGHILSSAELRKPSRNISVTLSLTLSQPHCPWQTVQQDPFGTLQKQLWSPVMKLTLQQTRDDQIAHSLLLICSENDLVLYAFCGQSDERCTVHSSTEKPCLLLCFVFKSVQQPFI